MPSHKNWLLRARSEGKELDCQCPMSYGGTKRAREDTSLLNWANDEGFSAALCEGTGSSDSYFAARASSVGLTVNIRSPEPVLPAASRTRMTRM